MPSQRWIIGLLLSVASVLTVHGDTCDEDPDTADIVVGLLQSDTKVKRHLTLSDNGANYQCDTTKLASDNLCIFTAAGDALEAGEVMEPSVVNRDAGDVNGRMVVDKDGNQLSLSMKPWENKVGEAAATAGSITGSEWMYTLSYELLVPLRNAMMFEPQTVTTDAAKWQTLTKVFVDCKIKTETIEYTPFNKYSTDDIYELLKDPNSYWSGIGPSLSNPILMYLEEGSADLWCAMTGENISDDHCPQVWSDNGMSEGDVSNCWEAAYDGLYGAGAATAALTAPATSASSPSTESGGGPAPPPASGGGPPGQREPK